MKHALIIPGLILIFNALALTGCGTSTKVTSTNERSVGQQLTDLEQARQQGIITDREYNRLKKAIINKND